MSVTDKDLISAERYSHVFADIWNLVQCTSCLLGHFVRPHNACTMLKMAVFKRDKPDWMSPLFIFIRSTVMAGLRFPSYKFLVQAWLNTWSLLSVTWQFNVAYLVSQFSILVLLLSLWPKLSSWRTHSLSESPSHLERSRSKGGTLYVLVVRPRSFTFILVKAWIRLNITSTDRIQARHCLKWTKSLFLLPSMLDTANLFREIARGVVNVHYWPYRNFEMPG